MLKTVYNVENLFLGSPDPGLNQAVSSLTDEDELSDIVDWENLSLNYASDESECRYKCPFIDYEAQESSNDDNDDDGNKMVKQKVARKSVMNLVGYSSSSSGNDENA